MAATIISEDERTRRVTIVGSKIRSLARLSRDIGKQHKQLRLDGAGPAEIQTAIQAQLDEFDAMRDVVVAELTAIPYLHQPYISTGVPAISNAIEITALNHSFDYFGKYFAHVQPNRIASGDEWDNFFAAGDVISLNDCEDKSNSGSYTVLAASTSVPIVNAYPYNSPEIVTNGEFAADASWTKAANWTIAAGVATSNGNSGVLAQSVATFATAPTAGALFRVTVTVSGAATGFCEVSLGGNWIGVMASNGSYTFVLDLSGADGIEFTSVSFDGDIDDVSIKEVGGVLISRPTAFTTNTADTKCRVLKEYDV